MKATLATLVCLLTVGFLSAAEITGNNTAVVIRKEVVKSNTGYQFLCVPVNGMTLNGEAAPITLESFLPAATLDAGTVAIVGTDRYTVQEGVKTWAADSKNADPSVNNPELPGGTMLWVWNSPKTKSASDTIVFCGQDRERVAPLWASLPAGQVTALMNDSSEPITLEAAAALQDEETRTDGDQILVIKAGSSDYKIYTYYVGEGWFGTGWGAPLVTDAVIAPGEAFYYYKVKVNQ